MVNVISTVRSMPGALWDTLVPQPVDKRLSDAVGKVFAEKESLIGKSLADKTRRFHPITGSCSTQVFHDVVNAMFVVFTSVKALLPAIAKLTPVLIASSAFGVIGGILNIVVGGVTLREAIQAFRNGDKAKGARLLICSIALFALGAFMILTTVATFVALGGVGLFLAANPWILPVLMLMMMLPLLYEIARDNKAIFAKQDPFSKMHLDEITKLLDKDIVNWEQIKNQLKDSDLDVEMIRTEFDKSGVKFLANRIELLQQKVGPKGAVESFKLFQAIIDENKETAQASMKTLKKQVRLWKMSQHIRLIQQIFFIVSFVFSVLLLKRVNTQIVRSLDNGFMILGLGLPAYMDACMPLLRNVPIIVPKVDPTKV